MNTTTTTAQSGLPMFDRTQVEAVIWRVAIAAFTYYPSKEAEEPGYTVQEDIDWALQPLGDLLLPQRHAIGERLRELITDPNADRRAFIRDLYAVTDS